MTFNAATSWDELVVRVGTTAPSVKQRLNVEYDSCNTLLPPEQVCGIHVLNEGSPFRLFQAF